MPAFIAQNSNPGFFIAQTPVLLHKTAISCSSFPISVIKQIKTYFLISVINFLFKNLSPSQLHKLPRPLFKHLSIHLSIPVGTNSPPIGLATFMSSCNLLPTFMSSRFVSICKYSALSSCCTFLFQAMKRNLTHPLNLGVMKKCKNEELEKTSGVLLNVLLTAQPMNRKHNTVYTGAD